MEEISSASNQRIKLAASLAQRKHRERMGLFVSEGMRICEMAVMSGWGIEFGLVTEKCLRSERGASLVKKIEGRCPLYLVQENAYKKASATETPQGILLVCQQKSIGLSELELPEKPLLVLLDGVQDPGNAGTIIRTADAAGAAAVILTSGSVDVFSEKVVRSTMGSLFHLPICQGVAVSEIKAFMQEHGLELLITALDETAKPHFAYDMRAPMLIAFGNEGSGVSEEVLKMGRKMYIPMAGRAESLNVGVSAAVVLYEAMRQRHYAK